MCIATYIVFTKTFPNYVCMYLVLYHNMYIVYAVLGPVSTEVQLLPVKLTPHLFKMSSLRGPLTQGPYPTSTEEPTSRLPDSSTVHPGLQETDLH